MAKKVTINKDACIGCGLCVGSLSSVFEMGDDGKAEAKAVSPEDESAVEDVKDQCPVGAIEVQ